MTKPDKPTYLFAILGVVDSHAAVLSRPDMQSSLAFSMMYAARITAWLLAAAVIVLSIVPPVLRPVTDLPHVFEHFAIYFATGLAFASGYERRLALLPIAFVAFAGAIELAQLLVPGRHARLSDFIVNSLGLCVGLITAATFREVLTRLQKEGVGLRTLRPRRHSYRRWMGKSWRERWRICRTITRRRASATQIRADSPVKRHVVS